LLDFRELLRQVDDTNLAIVAHQSLRSGINLMKPNQWPEEDSGKIRNGITGWKTISSAIPAVPEEKVRKAQLQLPGVIPTSTNKSSCCRFFLYLRC
jgi:hypothetical protein